MPAPNEISPSTGKMYMPSYPWRLTCFVQLGSDLHYSPISNTTHKTCAEAEVQATDWVRKPKRSACVTRRNDNQEVYRTFSKELNGGGDSNVKE